MSKVKRTTEEWLDWAQKKYDAAQERYAYGGRPDTMESYAALISALDSSLSKMSETCIKQENEHWGMCQSCHTLVRTDCVAGKGDREQLMSYCPNCGARVMQP